MSKVCNCRKFQAFATSTRHAKCASYRKLSKKKQCFEAASLGRRTASLTALPSKMCATVAKYKFSKPLSGGKKVRKYRPGAGFTSQCLSSKINPKLTLDVRASVFAKLSKKCTSAYTPPHVSPKSIPFVDNLHSWPTLFWWPDFSRNLPCRMPANH